MNRRSFLTKIGTALASCVLARAMAFGIREPEQQNEPREYWIHAKFDKPPGDLWYIGAMDGRRSKQCPNT